MISQDFLDKYLAKDADEILRSRYALEQYLLNIGFTMEQVEKIIEKGTRSIEKLMAEDPETLLSLLPK